MRRFHSYGPVDPELHFCVERRELVERCVSELAGEPDKGGHYFTIWAPRQAGKTWLMRRAVAELQARSGERFVVGALSMQGVLGENDSEETFWKALPGVFHEALGIKPRAPSSWDEVRDLFSRDGGLFDRPAILFIDEFDSLPRPFIDRLIGVFRKIFLGREAYHLHGLALIGVRAVLGVESSRGSPFNVQRSLHVPTLTRNEVEEMFGQYQAESGQAVEPAVVEKVHDTTRGQPGLVGWFGELLTEKYNPGPGRPIGLDTWTDVFVAACQIEWNNTILNLIKKAKGPYRDHVVELFTRSDVPFSLDQDWCNYLYLNGIIDHHEERDPQGLPLHVCRFSSPFVQLRLYHALTGDLVGDRTPIPAIDPLDDLSDVFTPSGIQTVPLLGRYRDYLARLKKRGLNPWKDQPRRDDFHFTEAVGHFHLYAWLKEAVGRLCVVSPEFPTGNGKVDLHLRRVGQAAILEVKSLDSVALLSRAREQAARYAGQLGLPAATLAVFVPTDDEAGLARLCGETVVEGVTVAIVAIGWT